MRKLCRCKPLQYHLMYIQFVVVVVVVVWSYSLMRVPKHTFHEKLQNNFHCFALGSARSSVFCSLLFSFFLLIAFQFSLHFSGSCEWVSVHVVLFYSKLTHSSDDFKTFVRHRTDFLVCRWLLLFSAAVNFIWSRRNTALCAIAMLGNTSDFKLNGSIWFYVDFGNWPLRA